jgi:hypothetical protein
MKLIKETISKIIDIWLNYVEAKESQGKIKLAKLLSYKSLYIRHIMNLLSDYLNFIKDPLHILDSSYYYTY